MFVPRDVNFNRRQAPVFDPVEVLGRHGYWCTPDYNDIRVYAPSATRATIKAGAKPIAVLNYGHVRAIQQNAQSDDDVLMMVASIAENGTIPDPLQVRVEQLANAKTAELQERLAKAEALIAELAAQRREDKIAAVAEEGAAAHEPVAKPEPDAKSGRPVALKKQKQAPAAEQPTG